MRWLFLVALLAGCWQRPAPATPDRTIRIGISAESWVLANGLHVVLVRDPRATQVELTVRYQVGSSDDPIGREGMAHVVEHLLFEPLLDGRSLSAQLEGAALAYNAFTEPEGTSYTARAWPAQLDQLVAIEAARLDERCATITDDAFGRAREIVRNEARERGASWQVTSEIDQALFPAGHPYHRRPATLATLGSISREEACAFADAHYGTNHAVVVISGPVDRARVTAALAPLERVRRDVSLGSEQPPAPERVVEDIDLPIKSPAVLIAWHLTGDSLQRAQQRAVLEMLAMLVPGQVNARTSLHELGGPSGQMLGIMLAPPDGTTAKDVIAGVERARFRLQDWFGSGLFEVARERAVVELVESFEDGVDRDRWIAEAALAGDVDKTAQLRIASLHGLSRARAKELAEAFTLETASILTLVPDDTPGPTTTTITPAIHEMPRILTADPAAAGEPAPRPAASFPRVIERDLPTGLHVVLVPGSSVHTFDARLVLPAGTAAEPAAQRGVALLAARGLRPSGGDATEMMRFWMGGGAIDVDVRADATVFDVHDVDSQLDQALVALGQLLGNGVYGDLADLQRDLAIETRLEPDQLLATRIWRRALFGESHPYVDAGLWQRAARVSVDQVNAFRAAHFVPAGATLIIAGGFDADLAAHWIDYAFADWRGEPTHAGVPAARPEPFAFAQPRTTSQVAFRAALPVAAPDRAAALVATEMLATALADVREQLAASYGVSASLSESRAGMAIVMAGDVDAVRADAAFALVRDRIAQLRATTPDTAARFVEARARVMNRLLSLPAGATLLADRLEHAIELGRSASDADATAEAVRTLTLERAMPVLAKLDLDRAAMLLSGHGASVTAAYKALGREPVEIRR
jgi:zinc protease